MRESTESFQPPENTESFGQKCLRWYHPLKMIPILSWIQQDSLSFETRGFTVTDVESFILYDHQTVQTRLSTKLAS